MYTQHVIKKSWVPVLQGVSFFPETIVWGLYLWRPHIHIHIYILNNFLGSVLDVCLCRRNSCRVYIYICTSRLQYKSHLNKQLNCWSLRCSCSIACRCYSYVIFILYLTHGFDRLGKDKCITRRDEFWDLVHLILEILRYICICIYVYVCM